MVHEPVDLMFNSWYPSDHLFTNICHTIPALFSHPIRGTQRSLKSFEGNMFHYSSGQQNMEINTSTSLALIGVPSSSFSGTLITDTSEGLVPVTHRNQQRQRKRGTYATYSKHVTYGMKAIVTNKCVHGKYIDNS